MSRKFNQREINTFPINPSILNKLSSAGLFVVDDFATLTPEQLSAGANLSIAEAEQVLNIIYNVFSSGHREIQCPKAISVLDRLQEEQDLGHIVTLSKNLDNMLGGGVPLGRLTEFYGEPGIGKTNICLQLAVDTHIPVEWGGVDGEAVYIDTEGTCLTERLWDLAIATVDHCLISVLGQITRDKLVAYNFTAEKVLAGIHHFYCQDFTELLACIHLLPTFINEHPKVKLIVVDSVACPFRKEVHDMYLRTKLLAMLGQNLLEIASKFSTAVVLTNQMTTKIHSDFGSELIPALGESWAHVSNLKILLYKENNQRMAVLQKSTDKPELCCAFQITDVGIRDVLIESQPHDESQPFNESESISLNVSQSLPSGALQSQYLMEEDQMSNTTSCEAGPSTSSSSAFVPPTKKRKV